MSAELLFKQRHVLDERCFVEIKVWRVPAPLAGSSHEFKYSLALVEDGECVIRFDNERGKGDHFHLGNRQFEYVFTTPAQLLEDFWSRVDERRST